MTKHKNNKRKVGGKERPKGQGEGLAHSIGFDTYMWRMSNSATGPTNSGRRLIGFKRAREELHVQL